MMVDNGGDRICLKSAGTTYVSKNFRDVSCESQKQVRSPQ